MKEWTLKQQFDTQHDEHHAKSAHYAAKERVALQAHDDAKAARDALISRSLTENVQDSDKTAAFKAVADAEMALDIARAEHTAFHRNGQIQAVTREQLLKDWNGVHVPAVRTEEVQPILDRAKNALSEYYNALQDALDLEVAYRDQQRQANEVAQSTRVNGYMTTPLRVMDVGVDLPRLTDDALAYIQTYHKMPIGYERVPIADKTKGKKTAA